MSVRRGEVFDARLDPSEGAEQAGTRPVIVLSRDGINAADRVAIVIPCTTMRPGRRVFPSQIVLQAPDGGLSADSIALGDQIRTVAIHRLIRFRGTLSPASLLRLERAVKIALDFAL